MTFRLQKHTSCWKATFVRSSPDKSSQKITFHLQNNMRYSEAPVPLGKSSTNKCSQEITSHFKKLSSFKHYCVGYPRACLPGRSYPSTSFPRKSLPTLKKRVSARHHCIRLRGTSLPVKSLPNFRKIRLVVR